MPFHQNTDGDKLGPYTWNECLSFSGTGGKDISLKNGELSGPCKLLDFEFLLGKFLSWQLFQLNANDGC